MDGEIHYSGHVHLRFTGHKFSSQGKLPLSGGASLVFHRGRSFDGEFDVVYVANAQDSRHIRASGFSSQFDLYHARKLPAGKEVSQGRFSSAGRAALVDIYNRGSFVDQGVGFIGFKFNVGNGTQYGWARIKTIVGEPDNKIAVEDYAWADPGEPILTGQKGEAEPGAVPDAGSLGALALGGAGLLAWRKRRSRG